MGSPVHVSRLQDLKFGKNDFAEVENRPIIPSTYMGYVSNGRATVEPFEKESYRFGSEAGWELPIQ